MKTIIKKYTSLFFSIAPNLAKKVQGEYQAIQAQAEKQTNKEDYLLCTELYYYPHLFI